MKKFTIPCRFGDEKAPFDVYIGDPSSDMHPLCFQAIWLAKNRGGTIPPEVMESFDKLYHLANKHDVSFEELCVHAMKAVNTKQETTPQSGEPETK